MPFIYKFLYYRSVLLDKEREIINNKEKYKKDRIEGSQGLLGFKSKAITAFKNLTLGKL